MSRPHNGNGEIDDEQMRIFSIEEEEAAEDAEDLEDDALEVYSAEARPDFDTALEAIQEDSVEPCTLTGFSGLERNQMRRLRTVWRGLPVEARRTIADHVLSLGLEDVLLDFQRFYRMMIDDDDARIRETGANGLAMDEDESLIDPLLGLLASDPDSRVRTAAAEALATFTTLGEFGELRGSIVRSLRDSLMAVARDDRLPADLRSGALASAAVQAGDPEIEQAVESFAASDDHDLRLGAYQAMGRSGSKRWIPMLDRASRDNDPEIRSQVARALGAFEDEVIPILTMLVREDTESPVRLDAIQSLGRVGGKRALDALEKIREFVSDDEAGAVQDAIAEAREWAELEDLESSFDDDDSDLW